MENRGLIQKPIPVWGHKIQLDHMIASVKFVLSAEND